MQATSRCSGLVADGSMRCSTDLRPQSRRVLISSALYSDRVRAHATPRAPRRTSRTSRASRPSSAVVNRNRRRCACQSSDEYPLLLPVTSLGRSDCNGPNPSAPNRPPSSAPDNTGQSPATDTPRAAAILRRTRDVGQPALRISALTAPCVFFILRIHSCTFGTRSGGPVTGDNLAAICFVVFPCWYNSHIFAFSSGVIFNFIFFGFGIPTPAASKPLCQKYMSPNFMSG